MANKIQGKNFEVTLISANLIHFVYYKNAVIGIEEIRDCFSIHDSLGVDENVRRIIESQKFASITKAARECVQNEARPAIAEAFVIRNLSQKILFNFYNKLRKGKHPIKAFDSFETAKKWIDTYE
jgi:ABC-type lipopolysaccharide export system ATPase subunit